MKSLLLPFLLMATAGGCASGGTEAEAPQGPIVWPAGHYELQGLVSVRRDTELREVTDQVLYQAELDLAADGTARPTGLSSQCQPSGQPWERRAQDRTGFRCDEVYFSMRLVGETISGQVMVAVQETIRRQGSCARYAVVGEQQVCVAWNFTVERHTATKTAPLQVRKTGT